MSDFTPTEYRELTGLTTADVSRYAKHGYIRPKRKNPELGEASGNVFIWTKQDVLAAKAHELLSTLYTGPMLHLLANLCADAIYSGKAKEGDMLLIPKPEAVIYTNEAQWLHDGPQNLAVIHLPDSV